MRDSLKILVVKDLHLHKVVFASIIYDPIGYTPWEEIDLDRYVKDYIHIYCSDCKTHRLIFDRLPSIPNEWTGQVCTVMDEAEANPHVFSIDVLDFEKESEAQPWRQRIYDNWHDQLVFDQTGVDPRVDNKAQWWNGFFQQCGAVIFAITLSIIVMLVGNILINAFSNSDSD